MNMYKRAWIKSQCSRTFYVKTYEEFLLSSAINQFNNGDTYIVTNPNTYYEYNTEDGWEELMVSYK